MLPLAPFLPVGSPRPGVGPPGLRTEGGLRPCYLPGVRVGLSLHLPEIRLICIDRCHGACPAPGATPAVLVMPTAELPAGLLHLEHLVCATPSTPYAPSARAS